MIRPTATYLTDQLGKFRSWYVNILNISIQILYLQWNILFDFFQLLSRTRPAVESASAAASDNGQNKLPKLQDFLEKRDFLGALTLLEFQRSTNELKNPGLIAYCCFHLGDFPRCLEELQGLLKACNEGRSEACDASMNESKLWLNIACTYFAMGMYTEAKEAAEKGSEGGLKTRLLFHLSHKLANEEALMLYHRKLEENLENQLSLASIHYLRHDFQSSIDIYKRILLDNRFVVRFFLLSCLCSFNRTLVAPLQTGLVSTKKSELCSYRLIPAPHRPNRVPMPKRA